MARPGPFVHPATKGSIRSAMAQKNIPLVKDEESASKADAASLLGRFEEAILLAALACAPEATAGAIKSRVEPHLGERHINCVLTTLDRLSRKGYVEFGKTQATKKRGGRGKKTYAVTEEARESLRRQMAIFTALADQAGIKAA